MKMWDNNLYFAPRQHTHNSINIATTKDLLGSTASVAYSKIGKQNDFINCTHASSESAFVAQL